MTERELCYEILYSIHIENELSHVALKRALDRCDREEMGLNKGFIAGLVNGVNETYLTLLYLIEKQAGRPIGKIKAPIRIMLAIGIYQGYYMSVPKSAACNESVKLAVKRGFSGLKGFVNGVLRGMFRNIEDVNEFLDKELADKPLIKRLSVLYSCPEWLVAHYVDTVGEKQTEELLKASLEKSEISVYMLRSRAGKEKALSGEVCKCAGNSQENDCEACDVTSDCQKIDGVYTGLIKLDGPDRAYRAEDASKLLSSVAYREGNIIVQDISSMLAGEMLPEISDCEVLDICAAPGGKAIHCADRFYDRNVKVVARDLTEDKLEKIIENIRRVKLSNIATEQGDALALRDEDIGRFGLVIADLPCSGLGVIGRKPDIKYKTKPEDIKSLAEIQRKILANAVRYVKAGGYLAFSTCTLAKAENEENYRFLSKLGLVPVSIKERVPKRYQEYLTADNAIQLMPGKENDGFYIALFKKDDMGENND